jgi:hypothetical protein
MTIREQSELIRETLAEWARTAGGRAAVAGDPAQILEILRIRPDGFVAIISFDSETPRTEYDELGGMDRTFKVVISRGKGFKLDTGESLTDGAAGAGPLFDLVEQARELLRALPLDPETSLEVLPKYLGTSPYEVQGYLLDAYEIRLSIGTQIPSHAN